MTGELAVGRVLGWLDGAAKIDGFSDGMEDDMADSLGDSDCIDVDTPVLVGIVLGSLDG